MNKPDPLNERRDQLREQLGRIFPVEVVELKIAKQLLKILRISDEEKALEILWPALEADERPETQPYWVRSWASSIAACHQIAELNLTGKSVLDLGCGIGITGTFAASCGAKVTFADAVKHSLLFAEFNAMNWRDKVEFKQVNWCGDKLDQKFDLIIGSDIIYDRTDWHLLARFWNLHLAKSGEVLLVEPFRQSCNGFGDWATPQGWTVLTSSRKVGKPGVKFRVFRLSKARSLAQSPWANSNIETVID